MSGRLVTNGGTHATVRLVAQSLAEVALLDFMEYLVGEKSPAVRWRR